MSSMKIKRNTRGFTLLVPRTKVANKLARFSLYADTLKNNEDEAPKKNKESGGLNQANKAG